MSFAVSMAVIGTRHKSVLSSRDHRLRAGSLNRGDKGVGVIALVCNHLFGVEALDEGWALRDVMHFAAGQIPTHRITERIGRHMNLRAQSAARASDGLFARFFWAPAACWCARTTVLSSRSDCRSVSAPSTATIRCQTPLLPQREKRVYTLCQLPNDSGRSRHGLPVRAIHKTASTNCRLSLAVTPQSPALPGNRCSMRSHWSFRSIFRTGSGLFEKTRMYRHQPIVYRP
jgi:hypothetical protein